MHKSKTTNSDKERNVSCSTAVTSRTFTVTVTMDYDLAITCTSNAEGEVITALQQKVTDLYGDWPSLCPDNNCNNAVVSAKCEGSGSSTIVTTIQLSGLPWVSLLVLFDWPCVYRFCLYIFLRCLSLFQAWTKSLSVYNRRSHFLLQCHIMLLFVQPDYDIAVFCLKGKAKWWLILKCCLNICILDTE